MTNVRGMPTERPVCQVCGTAIGYWTRVTWEGKIGNKTFDGWRGYAITDKQYFCTLRCAREFANAAWKAGYRIVKR